MSNQFAQLSHEVQEQLAHRRAHLHCQAVWLRESVCECESVCVRVRVYVDCVCCCAFVNKG